MTPPAAFLTQLRVLELPDGRRQLIEPLYFFSAEIANASNGIGIVIVPAGTITNYASVPRGLWNTFPPDGPWKWAATVHDAASNGQLVTADGTRIHLVKHLTDNLFREAMTCPPCDQVPGWKRWLMYRLVKQFGRGAYGGPPIVVVNNPAPIAAIATNFSPTAVAFLRAAAGLSPKEPPPPDPPRAA